MGAGQMRIVGHRSRRQGRVGGPEAVAPKAETCFNAPHAPSPVTGFGRHAAT